MPILTFLQIVLPGLGRWGGAFHPLNGIIVLAMFGWLAWILRQPEAVAVSAPAPVQPATG